MVATRKEGMYLGVTTFKYGDRPTSCIYARKNETLLQVDEEVGQLAHQDDLQVIGISLVAWYKRNGESCPDKESFSTSSTSLEEYSPTSSVDPWTRIFTRANLNPIRLLQILSA